MTASRLRWIARILGWVVFTADSSYLCKDQEEQVLLEPCFAGHWQLIPNLPQAIW